MCRGEVSLRVPHGPGCLDLIGGQLVVVVDLHRAVDDGRTGYGLQISDFQNHNLEK